MNLNTVYAAAGQADSHEVVFATPAGHVESRFHLTEFKRNRVDSVDCGGVSNQWEELAVELLPSSEGDAMTARTLTAIIAKVEETLPGVSELPLLIEHAEVGGTVARYHVVSYAMTTDQLVFTLGATQGECKANTRALAAEGGSCCAPRCC